MRANSDRRGDCAQSSVVPSKEGTLVYRASRSATSSPATASAFASMRVFSEKRVNDRRPVAEACNRSGDDSIPPGVGQFAVGHLPLFDLLLHGRAEKTQVLRFFIDQPGWLAGSTMAAGERVFARSAPTMAR
jgi:hypothetical protein